MFGEQLWLREIHTLNEVNYSERGISLLLVRSVESASNLSQLCFAAFQSGSFPARCWLPMYVSTKFSLFFPFLDETQNNENQIFPL